MIKKNEAAAPRTSKGKTKATSIALLAADNTHVPAPYYYKDLQKRGLCLGTAYRESSVKPVRRFLEVLLDRGLAHGEFFALYPIGADTLMGEGFELSERGFDSAAREAIRWSGWGLEVKAARVPVNFDPLWNKLILRSQEPTSLGMKIFPTMQTRPSGIAARLQKISQPPTMTVMVADHLECIWAFDAALTKGTLDPVYRELKKKIDQALQGTGSVEAGSANSMFSVPGTVVHLGEMRVLVKILHDRPKAILKTKDLLKLYEAPSQE